ncbi:MAG: SIR2 family protein [Chloroflexi bacterium]|nr:SIR2 family protein [Chloroflexota bacterium]
MTILGSRLWGSIPDADHLALHLARTFELPDERRDLAAVAQYVAVTQGLGPLHREIEEVFRREPDPSAVHWFLARVAKLAYASGEPRCPMVVTTNYDTALEQAFERVGAPFDLALFVQSNIDGGRFIHVPWKGEARQVVKANAYRDFPMHRNDELERSIIVKVHGAAGGTAARRELGRDYLLTEDHYIDYLVTDSCRRSARAAACCERLSSPKNSSSTSSPTTRSSVRLSWTPSSPTTAATSFKQPLGTASRYQGLQSIR